MELREWQYMSKPTTNSSGYKKRFEKLIKYHIDHASSELESITKKDIRDNYFHLTEHYNNGHHEFDRDIVVSYDKSSDTFMLHIFVDGKEVDNILRKGYEAFVDAAEGYMFLPDSGTQEYDDLLVEWVAMKNTSSQPASKTSSKTSKERFQELTNYMIKNKSTNSVVKAEVVQLDDGGFKYKEYRKLPSVQLYVLTLVVGYSIFTSNWKFELYMDTDLIEEVSETGIEALVNSVGAWFSVPAYTSPEHKSICESYSSIADDFKLYENLWD